MIYAARQPLENTWRHPAAQRKHQLGAETGWLPAKAHLPASLAAGAGAGRYETWRCGAWRKRYNLKENLASLAALWRGAGAGKALQSNGNISTRTKAAKAGLKAQHRWHAAKLHRALQSAGRQYQL